MASYETVPIEKYSLEIRRFTREKAGRTIYLSPPSSYAGLVKLIRLYLNDGYFQAGSLRRASPSPVGRQVGDPPVNAIDAYASPDDFVDLYHILQTEKPCWFTYSLQGSVQVPSTGLSFTDSIDLRDWILGTTYPPYQGELVGEGHADRSP